ncbi:MAG: hypothetical protein E7376_02205 [Clostridiales bacterium]|nr:hypothetical protein [Clostridiales bacterium]
MRLKFNVKEYTAFRKNYKFEYKKIINVGEQLYCEDMLVEDITGKYSESEKILNIGYNFKNSKARMLSNLYPMRFKFKGKWVASIEGVLQGVKYKDKKTQNLVLGYCGLDAYHTRAANFNNFWGNCGILYWQGKPMQRQSLEYELFLDELYVSALKNPLYQNALLASGNKYLLHHMGNENINETVLTRFEFELRLNSLREYLKTKIK